MNKKIFLLIILFFIIPSVAKGAQPLAQKLKGRILLQVESKGEAWYVNPKDNQRYYFENGAAAIGLVRSFGLGITNVDLGKIPIGVDKRFNNVDSDGDGLSDKLEAALGTDPMNSDSDNDSYGDGIEVSSGYNPLGPGNIKTNVALVNRLKGRILIQSEGKGEAWYVYPKDGRRYYMGDGDSAYQIMKFLGVGISNKNLAMIPANSLSEIKKNFIKEIQIVPFGTVSDKDLQIMRDIIQQDFLKTNVMIDKFIDLPTQSYNTERQQYDADVLRDLLEKRSSDQSVRIVGVADVDLFAPGINFVFSDPSVGGNSLVLSVTRLHLDYDLENAIKDENLLKERYRKVVLRALGVTFGFGVSPFVERSCMMAFSNSLEKLDAKGTSWCDEKEKILGFQGL